MKALSGLDDDPSTSTSTLKRMGKENLGYQEDDQEDVAVAGHQIPATAEVTNGHGAADVNGRTSKGVEDPIKSVQIGRAHV